MLTPKILISPACILIILLPIQNNNCVLSHDGHLCGHKWIVVKIPYISMLQW